LISAHDIEEIHREDVFASLMGAMRALIEFVAKIQKLGALACPEIEAELPP